MIVSEADAAVMRSYRAYEVSEKFFRPLTDELGGYVAGGVENLRSVDGQGYIVAPKHGSNWDHFVVGRAMVELPYWSQQERPDLPPLQPRGMHWMAKKSLWKYPGVRQFVEQCNAFAVDNSGTGEGLPQHLVEHIGYLMENEAVLTMYSEGHRYPYLDRANLHSTIARMALQYGVPVVPAGIAGPTKGPKLPRAVYFEQPISHGQVDPDSPEYPAAKEALMDELFHGMMNGFQHAGELYHQMPEPEANLLRTLNELTSSHASKLAVATLSGLTWKVARQIMQGEGRE